MKSKKDDKKNKNDNEEKNNKTNNKSNNNNKSKAKLTEKKEEEENILLTPKEKPKNIERYIYITRYSDSDSFKIINQLFKDINTAAFNMTEADNNLVSKILTEEEQNNNEIDYISGFQIIDNKIRFTIIEGITGKSMLKVKKSLPKLQMNNKVIKIFSNDTILFTERKYAKFNLLLKNIKLRNDLDDILTSFDIYKYANKYRNIYDTFMNLGTILRADTLEDINISNAFPDVDKLNELEMKFADVLNNEDLTGIKKVTKKNIKHLLTDFNNDKIINKTESNNNNDNSYNSLIQNAKKSIMRSMKLMPIRKKVHFTEVGEEKAQMSNNNIEKINDNKCENNRYLTIDVNNTNNNNTNRIKKKINFNSLQYIDEKIAKYDKLYL